MVVVVEAPIQLPLVHIVESDDIYFKEQADVLGFPVLRDLDGHLFVDVGAQYYEALWVFNQAQAEARRERARAETEGHPETRDEATLRLLSERPTVDDTVDVLRETVPAQRRLLHVDPARTGPGKVPLRLFASRPPHAP